MTSFQINELSLFTVCSRRTNKCQFAPAPPSPGTNGILREPTILRCDPLRLLSFRRAPSILAAALERRADGSSGLHRDRTSHARPGTPTTTPAGEHGAPVRRGSERDDGAARVGIRAVGAAADACRKAGNRPRSR